MDPQLKAISTIDKNVAVNAGAGTGKTKVLTERFVYILEHGVLEENKEVESIVAITFTKKATQEMVERIRKEIRKNFHKGNKWTRFYRDMEKSNISTIHSFCGKLLRENPIESKVDPLFEVLDDRKANELLNESILEALDKRLEDKNIFKLMLTLKEFRTKNLVDDIKGVYNLIRTVGVSLCEVKDITINHLEGLKIDNNDLILIKDTIIYLQGKLGKNSNIVKLGFDPLWIKFIENEPCEEELFYILEHIRARLGTSKKEEEYFELLRTTLDRVLISKEAGFKWLYSSMLDLLIAIDKIYSDKKEKISGLDYDDLQIKVLTLLDNKIIRKKYQNKFRYIMIDEFQDTNELQKKIFYKLSTDQTILDQQNLFVVGDPKQSIYAFRGADIDVFYDVIEDIKNASNEKPITLSKNYRTVDTVLGFINSIFTVLMEDKYNQLAPFHLSQNKIDIEVLEDSEFDAGSEESIIFEANLIAKRIKRLVVSGEYNYKDFALLFRATTRNFYYEEALRSYNIPYYNSSSRQFFKRQEILDIINALKSISNPYDTISSIGFLRGPMVGLSDNTIFWLLKDIEFNLHNTISSYTLNQFRDLSQDEIDKIKKAKDLLDYCYSIKDICSISYLLDKILEKTNFIEAHLLEHNGKQSLANIYKFIDIVNSYENSNMESLEDFIDYIEILKNDNESEGTIESEESDVVKLLTIHKSKGLQFPVVIIPEMSKDIRNIHPRFLFNKDIGIGIKTNDIRGIYDSIKVDLDERDKEERKRILYVAMTRAEKMLILGNQGKNKGFKEMVKDLLSPEYITSIRNVELDKESIAPVKMVDTDIHTTAENESFRLELLGLENIPNKRFERYSISQFLAYKSCKRSFYLDYYKRLKVSDDYEFDEIESIPSPNISAIDKGNIVHRFCELYSTGLDKKVLLQNITMSYGIDFDEDIYVELEPYIDNYIHYSNSKTYDKVYIEKPFHLNMGNNYITGVIDRINIKDGMIEIVDFKTSHLKNKDNLIAHYGPQLNFYAYAVEKIMKMNVNKASILFLENGEEVFIDISKETIERVKKEISEFIIFVENNSTIDAYNTTDSCNNYCNHISICEGIGKLTDSNLLRFESVNT